MGENPTPAETGIATEIPGTWPGPGPVGSGPFAGRPNAADDDPGRLDPKDGEEVRTPAP